MIIALSGFKGSGKDELASYLVKKYGFTRTSFADPLKDSVAEEYGIDRLSLDDPKRKESPILDLPIDPQDKFTKMVTESMFKEFRSKDGFQPTAYTYKNDKFYGVFSVLMATGEVYEPSKHQGRDVMSGYLEVYHTPRSLAILKGSTNRVVASNFWVQKAISKINFSSSNLHVISDFRYRSEGAQLVKVFGKDVTFVRINRFKDSPSSDPSERDLDEYLFDHHIDNTKELSYAHLQLEDILKKLKNEAR